VAWTDAARAAAMATKRAHKVSKHKVNKGVLGHKFDPKTGSRVNVGVLGSIFDHKTGSRIKR
jgi:hypothetical protein